MKVSELTGQRLDYWVAQATGMLRMIDGSIEEQLGECRPSSKWKDGGPLIDRHIKDMHCDGGKMKAITYDGVPGWGGTYLEAACRAIITSKFGHEVPEE